MEDRGQGFRSTDWLSSFHGVRQRLLLFELLLWLPFELLLWLC